jgi:tRNA-binding protein
VSPPRSQDVPLPLPPAEAQGFFRYDLRVATVVQARPHPTARVPAYILTLDLGPLGQRVSSAQLTRRYTPQELVGRQVVVVANLPPKRVGGISSQVLVLGALPEPGEVVLLSPDAPVPNGSPVA